MARPTKEEIKKRDKIIDLGLFVRDNPFYMNFEEITKDFSKLRLSDTFCEECLIRDFINKNEIIKFRNFKNEIDKIEIVGKLEKLEKIDKFSYFYYAILYLNRPFIKKQFSLKPYEVNNSIELHHIVQALGEKYAFSSPKDDYCMPISLESLIFNMPKKDKQKLLEYCKSNRTGKTFINHESIDLVHDIERVEDGILNRVNIEIDLTKPKEEILRYIEMIKDDFDKDPKNIPTIYSLLGDDIAPYLCEADKCDIYKSKEPKPINGRLADILFIYDCKKIGLNNDYIIDEVNRYWQDVKNLYRDTFRSSTLSSYYALAQKYIDNKEYKDLISGHHQ